MDIKIPTEYDMYRACYLTMRGWRCSEGSRECWYKDDKTHLVDKWVGGDSYKKVPSGDFTLSEAFDLEYYG